MNKKLNVLIENGTYDCHNAGDLSMLKVCIDRLQSHFPDDNIFTVTEAPDSLKLINNKTIPVSLLKGKVLWLQERNILGGLHKVLPIKNSVIDSFESSIRRDFNSLAMYRISKHIGPDSKDLSHLQDYMQLIDSIDFAIVSGGGFITDSFEDHAIRLLETIYLILKRGKKVAFLGQGIGPINSPKLKKMALKVFPLVTMFTLRESVKGPILLTSLGVKPSKIIVTGDDAIELAATGREHTLGENLGFNIRIASYAAVENDSGNRLVKILQEHVKTFKSSIIPVPISWHEKDLQNALNLLATGNNDDYSYDEADDLESIDGLIKQISKCRVVVTGSYHAAVFALAQGVPVIAVANTEYYVDKFNGLLNMFNGGLKIVVLNQPNWENLLKTFLNEFWINAQSLKESLIVQADKQIELSKKAYSDFFKLVDNTQ